MRINKWQIMIEHWRDAGIKDGRSVGEMKLSEYIRRMREIQADMYDGGKPSVEELIEMSRPQGLDLHLLTEQELEVMIEGINNGMDVIENAYLYFDDEEQVNERD